MDVVDIRNCSLKEKDSETASLGLGDWMTMRSVSSRWEREEGEVKRVEPYSSRKTRRWILRFKEKSLRSREESERSTRAGPK